LLPSHPYRIKGTNADKFALTADTGILSYKTIQATAHDNDAVTIVATDVAGNEAEQPITVSVEVMSLSLAKVQVLPLALILGRLVLIV
jgi:hypothetical protein